MIEPAPLKEIKPSEEDQPIDGGSIVGFEELHFHEGKHRAYTARWLAYLFLGLLAFSIAIHYATTVVMELYGLSAAADKLAIIYHSWLPVVASLVSAAATYYFTKEK
jgi:hypothetical protein